MKAPAGRHTVKLHGIVVGYSDLDDTDPALGTARGSFRPGIGYDLVQPVFALYAEAVPTPGGAVVDQEKLDRYHRSRDALGLVLEDDTGRTIAVSGVHVADYTHLADGGIHLEVLIGDRDYWKQRAKEG